MSHIKGVHAREVLDSRGNPTVEVEVQLEDGSMGRAIVPSGASVGKNEALELRDNDTRRFLGKGVLGAVANVRGPIANELIGLPAEEQADIDNKLIDLDGTPDKSHLGANAMLGVSLAVAHAAAANQREPLFRHIHDLFGVGEPRMPVPMMNIVNGGAHANNSIDIQEFMIVPMVGGSFSDSLRCGVEVFQCLKRKLDSMGYSTAVGDEGGFAPDLHSNSAALDVIIEAVDLAGLEMGNSVSIALDCAASEFFEDGTYQLNGGTRHYQGAEWCGLLEDLVNAYPDIVSIEDGMDESEYDHWVRLYERLGDRIQLVGDDLFVTNIGLLRQGIENRWANSILVKLNQIGTLSETLEVIRHAHDNGLTTVISHRSGDTEDTTIADLAVGTGAGQIKTGSCSRSERIAKYNRLLRIEEMLQNPQFRGKLEFRQFQG